MHVSDRNLMFPFAYKFYPFGWFHLIYFGLVIPLSAVFQARKFRSKPLPNRLKYFQMTALTIVCFGAASLACAHSEGITLFPKAVPTWQSVLAGCLMYAAGVAAMRPRWRAAVEKRARVVHLYMPSNATERMWWIVVAILAGVLEEISWRGVQTALGAHLFGSAWLGVLFSISAFALAHAIQGWKSVAIIAVFAIAFHTLVWLSGSLYVAMAVHVLYDITAGISYGRLGKSLGYAPETSDDVPAPV